ncbi:MAG: hypothetical protein ACP5IO_04015 [Elusimicrobiales bacterium]
MENNQNQQKDSQVTQETEIQNQISDEVEAIRKRNRLLKILIIILTSIIIIFAAIVYFLYSRYTSISKNIEEVVFKISQENKTNNLADQIVSNHQLTPSSISFESSSLSKIGFSKEMMESMVNSQNTKKVEEIVDEYYNDPAINSFIEKFRNDPEIKDIFEAPPKERPLKMFKKMNDPIFMQKITKELLSNPQLMKSLMKMGTDPRIYQMMKNASFNKTIKISTTQENKQD